MTSAWSPAAVARTSACSSAPFARAVDGLRTPTAPAAGRTRHPRSARTKSTAASRSWPPRSASRASRRTPDAAAWRRSSSGAAPRRPPASSPGGWRSAAMVAPLRLGRRRRGRRQALRRERITDRLPGGAQRAEPRRNDVLSDTAPRRGQDRIVMMPGPSAPTRPTWNAPRPQGAVAAFGRACAWVACGPRAARRRCTASARVDPRRIARGRPPDGRPGPVRRPRRRYRGRAPTRVLHTPSLSTDRLTGRPCGLPSTRPVENPRAGDDSCENGRGPDSPCIWRR